MVIMAVDHTRDFFTSYTVDPGSPVQSWGTLFATRWITHICAPGFIALAGTSIYLQRQGGKSVRQIQYFLLTRGLWLACFDFVGFGFLLSFSLPPLFTAGPLWVAGFSMIALAFLLPLPTRIVGAMGAAILLLHNLLDRVPPSAFGHASILWDLLHQQTLVHIHGLMFFIVYPLLPWIGIISVGYALGALLSASPARRQRLAALLGTSSLVVFCILRATQGYGDSRSFIPGPDMTRSAMTFFDLQKYPPSLHYVLATGGVLLLLFALLDLSVSRDILSRPRAVLDVYGRVPFFFFTLHLLLLHIAALLLAVTKHLDWHQWLMPGALLFHNIPGWGFELPGVYAAWLAVLFVTYWPCRWFGQLKARRRNWWLSYL
jgi:uncharacterized membrane protein